MLKKTFTIMFALCIFISAHSQTLTIKDSSTGMPLELVTLYSDQPFATAITDAHGQTDVSGFFGSEKIKFNLIGYQEISASYEEIEKAGFELLMEMSHISLGGVTVTANRWSQSSRDVPAKITTITPREVVLQNPQTAADLLGSSGEVYIQKSQMGGGSPMIRGFSTNRLLITVDGVRMNTAIFRSGNLQNVISLDPFAVENTEILFGPGSVMYGSDAIGGVMSFKTLTPKLASGEEELISGNALMRYASANNEIAGHLDVNLGWKKWAMVTSFSHFNFDDLQMGTQGPDDYLRPFYVQRVDGIDEVVSNTNPLIQNPTGYNQSNFMQKVRFQPGKNWEFNLGYHYSATSDYPRYDRLIRTRDGLPRSGEWFYGPQKWQMTNLSISNKSNNRIYDEMAIRIAYQQFEESRHDRNFNEVILNNRMEEVKAFSSNFDFTKKYSEVHKLFYGLEWVNNDVESTGSFENILTGETGAASSRYPNSTWASYAAYITYVFKPSAKFDIQTGVRYNQFVLNANFDTTLFTLPFINADLNNGALTGNLGFVLNPQESLTLSANFSTGFRAPNVDDIGKIFDSEPGAVVVPNPNLKAEYVYNAEIGAAKIVNDIFQVDFSAYYSLLENAMVSRDYSLDGSDSIMYDGELSRVQAIQNASEAYVYGIQAGLKLKLTAGFGFQSSLSYQKGEEELDDGSKSPLRHSAPLFGVSRITYKMKKLKIDFYAAYNGEISHENLAESEKGKAYLYALDNNGNPYAPAWYTLNLKTMYQLTEEVSFSAGLENITDQRYKTYSSGIAAAGRNFIFSVRFSF